MRNVVHTNIFRAYLQKHIRGIIARTPYSEKVGENVATDLAFAIV